MHTSRQKSLLLASIVNLVAGTASAQAPRLEYGFEPGKHYGYDITIKVDTAEYAETYTGFTLFGGARAQEDRIRLDCKGRLDPDIKWKRDRGSTRYRPSSVTMRSHSVVVDRRGKLRRAGMMGASPLPYVLGLLETLTFENLPAEPQNQWRWEDEFEIVESSSLGPRFFHSPSRKAKEEIDYTITGVQGDVVRIDKKYLMRSGEGVANIARARMEGNGSVVFDRRAGAVSSVSMKYNLLLKDNGDSRTVTALVDCRLMNPARLEQLIAEMEEKRKQTTGEIHAELPKKPLPPAERAKLLRDLRSQDPKVVEAAVVRLISAERDDRPADFAVPLAKILHETRPWYSDLSLEGVPDDAESARARHEALVKAAQREFQRAAQRRTRSKAAQRDLDLRDALAGLRPKVAQALVVWATPEAEAALIEATADQTVSTAGPLDHMGIVADPAYEALVTIGTESAARAIARKIPDPSKKPVEVLKRMGPVAEAPMIELLFDQSGGNAIPRAACEVLAEVGGLRSVPALRQATQSRDTQVQAQAALEAIAKREGLSVEELLAKAQSVEPAIAPGSTAAASGFRTWTDNTGQFQIEAQLVSVADGVVKLKSREGKTIDVPTDRLSQADRDYLEASKPAQPDAPRTAQPTPPVTGEPRDTELLGGPGGFEFRFLGANREPLLGIRYRVGSWANEQALVVTEALFDRRSTQGPGVLVAKEGYAVGGMNVDAQTLVNALEITFMRLKPDGSLDPSDSYTSPWVGVRSRRPTKTLGGTGAPVIGIYGRRGLVLNAAGLVVCED